MFTPVLPCRVLSSRLLSSCIVVAELVASCVCDVLSRLVSACLSCLALSCLVFSCPVLFCWVLSRLVLSSLILPCVVCKGPITLCRLSWDQTSAFRRQQPGLYLLIPCRTVSSCVFVLFYCLLLYCCCLALSCRVMPSLLLSSLVLFLGTSHQRSAVIAEPNPPRSADSTQACIFSSLAEP